LEVGVDEEPEEEQAGEKGTGQFLGVPYDVREPTVARAKSRMWNPDEPRLFPPKSFGWGWTFNFYWFVHPLRWRARHRRPPTS
jgi:hypothetical protein